jgi:transposase
VWQSIVGIDQHKSVSQVSVVGPQGPQRANRKFFHDEASLQELCTFIGSQPRPIRAVVEATGHARWMLRFLRERCGVEEVRLVNPVSVGTRQGVAKTDKLDAWKLASKERSGDLRYAYEPTEEEYAFRMLSRRRRQLVNQRTRLVNTIRSVLAEENLKVDAQRLHGRKGQAELEPLLAKLPEASREVVACYLELVDDLAPKIARLEKRIREKVQTEDSEVARRARRIMGEVPSCKELSAAGVAAEMGQPARFDHGREVASYTGVTPLVRGSAGVNHTGPLSKMGNPHLRYWLGQLAVRLLAKDDQARRWADRHGHLHGNQRRSALARRLVVGIWASQKRDTCFELRYALGLPPDTASQRRRKSKNDRPARSQAAPVGASR